MKKSFIIAITMLLMPLCQLQAENIDTHKRVKIGGAFFASGGGDDLKLGYTGSFEEIKLNAGGILGFDFKVGFGLHPNLDLDVSTGMRTDDLGDDVSNAEGHFDAFYTKLTLMGRKAVSDKTFIKAGAGLGYYTGVEMMVEFSFPAVPEKLTVNYDDAFGYHLTGELETFVSEKTALTLGVTYNSVKYDYTNADIWGIPVFITDRKIASPDASNFDIFAGLNYYF